MRLERERKHEPAEHDGRPYETGEDHPAKSQLIRHLVLREQREDKGDKECEQDEQKKMTVHDYLRPSAMS